MKIKLIERLKPYYTKNKCSECEHAYIDKNGNQGCINDARVVNAYGCNDDLNSDYTIQEGEEVPNYTDYDSKDKFLDEYQKGGH